MSSEDWNAAISSEIFRIYASEQLKNDANKAENELNEKNLILESFSRFEDSVNKNPKLKEVFVKLQQAFISNPAGLSKVDPKFVDAVLLLKLADDSENELEVYEEEHEEYNDL